MLSFLVRTVFAIEPVKIEDYFEPAKYFNSVSSLVNVVLPNLFTIAGIVTLIAVVVAGFNVILHAGKGEGEKTARDKDAFTAAVVGLIIIFGGYFLVKIVEYILGYSLLNPLLPE